MIALYLLGSGALVRCVPRSSAFAGISLLAVTAAAAGDMNSAVLRGSRAYEATPSYQIAPAVPSYEYAPPPRGAVMAPVPAAVPGYSFEFGARYWYSSGKLAKDLYDDPRFSNDIVSRLTYDGLTANSFEAFGKIALPSNLFIKGYAGISGLSQGKPERRGLPAADHSLFQHDEQPERRTARLHDRRSRLRLRRQSDTPACRCSPATAMSARR